MHGKSNQIYHSYVVFYLIWGRLIETMHGKSRFNCIFNDDHFSDVLSGGTWHVKLLNNSWSVYVSLSDWENVHMKKTWMTFMNFKFCLTSNHMKHCNDQYINVQILKKIQKEKYNFKLSRKPYDLNCNIAWVWWNLRNCVAY